MGDQELWTAVDDVIVDALLPGDEDLVAALEATAEAGMPAISVSPTQGRFLGLLVAAIGARRVLEVGTLGGYSTICMARSLPVDGSLVTLERDPHHAEVAASNVARAGHAGQVEILVGAALDTLPTLASDPGGAFDLAFIDADKQHNADYFTWALRLVRPGGLIIVDNVVRGGAIADPSTTDSAVEGVRRLFALMAGRTDAPSTALQTVGAKGYDGFTLTVVPG